MKIGIICNHDKPQIKELIPGIVEFLLSAGQSPILESETAEVMKRPELGKLQKDLLTESDALVTLGGDGTILHLARNIYPRQIPVMGVNLGKVGFLSEFTVDDVYPALEALISGKVGISERSMLHVEVSSTGSKKISYSSPALNDVYITRRPSGRMAHLRVFHDRCLINSYRADGLLISTPTGSTAHAMSAGGPILLPKTGCFVVVPICPFTLMNRPVVVSDQGELSVIPGQIGQDLVVVVDGQIEQRLQPDEKVLVKLAPEKFILATSPSRSVFDIMREKFSWGN